MGEYWKPVNLTKREYIHPHDLGDGLKRGEWTQAGSATLALIAARWSDDDVIFDISDYDNVLPRNGNYRGQDQPGDWPLYDLHYDNLNERGFVRVKSVDDSSSPHGVCAQPEPAKAGRLDGLHIQPVTNDSGLKSLHFTVDTLPGMRLIVDADAARELLAALGALLT